MTVHREQGAPGRPERVGGFLTQRVETSIPETRRTRRNQRVDTNGISVGKRYGVAGLYAMVLLGTPPRPQYYGDARSPPHPAPALPLSADQRPVRSFSISVGVRWSQVAGAGVFGREVIGSFVGLAVLAGRWGRSLLEGRSRDTLTSGCKGPLEGAFRRPMNCLENRTLPIGIQPLSSQQPTRSF